MKSSDNQLKLPYTFEVEKELWNIVLDKILRNSVIGSLIIIAISLAVSILFDMSLPTLIFIVVFLLLFFAKRKEITALREIAGYSYLLKYDSINILLPEAYARRLYFEEVKEVNKAAYGLIIIPKIETKEPIYIPKSVANFDGIVLFFEELNLLSS